MLREYLRWNNGTSTLSCLSVAKIATGMNHGKDRYIEYKVGARNEKDNDTLALYLDISEDHVISSGLILFILGPITLVCFLVLARECIPGMSEELRSEGGFWSNP